jgi:branched-chain amino acid transport system permease protein
LSSRKSIVTKLLQTLADGTAVGALYALIALGYTLVYGILQFINFAHSDVFAFGAWMSFTIATALAIFVAAVGAATPPPWYIGLLVLLASMAACGLLGLCIERFAYRPLRNAPRLNVLITAIGVSLLLQNIGQLEYLRVQQEDQASVVDVTVKLPSIGTIASMSGVTRERAVVATWPKHARPPAPPLTRIQNAWVQVNGPQLANDRVRELSIPFGPYPRGMPQMLEDRVVYSAEVEPPKMETPAGGGTPVQVQPAVNVHLVDVTILGTAILLMLSIEWLIFRTKLGLAMRAVAFNHRTAALMGINVDRVIAFTFGLSAALAAAAGFLFALSPKYSQLRQTADTIWVLLGLKAFVAAVVGGIGNVRGAMLGGLCIGLIEFLGVAYVSDKYRDVYVFSVLILVLLVRPSGILGKATREKV